MSEKMDEEKQYTKLDMEKAFLFGLFTLSVFRSGVRRKESNVFENWIKKITPTNPITDKK